MTPEPQSRTPIPGAERAKQFLVLSALVVLVAACALPTGRDVRAYNTCVGRHPGEAALCEGPRQAYVIEGSTLQLGAAHATPRAADRH
jgi:hypothetical protein